MNRINVGFKKNKILLLLICIFSMFIGVQKVNAAETVMFIECEYALDYGSIKGSGSIFVSSTELKTSSGNRFELKARTNSSKDEFENLGDIKNYFGYDVDNDSTSVSTFDSAMLNEKACPKYMAIEYKSGKSNYVYKAMFYNDINRLYTHGGNLTRIASCVQRNKKRCIK